MIHTVLLFQTLTSSEYWHMYDTLMETCRTNNEKIYLSKGGGVEFTLQKVSKIRKVCLVKKEIASFQGNCVMYYEIQIVLNPTLLLNNNDYTKRIELTDSVQIEELIHIFNKEIKRLGLSIVQLTELKIKRIDYAINIETDRLQMYMELVKRGDKPLRFREYTLYDQVGKRRKDLEDSYYLISSSVNINFYNKTNELLKSQKINMNTNKEGVIRLEVQCKKSKVYTLQNKYKMPCRTIEFFLEDHIGNEVIRYYYERLIGFEDYYSMRKARQIIMQSYHSEKIKARMIDILRLIAQKRSVYKAYEQYILSDTGEYFNRTLKQIKALGINPVAIPKAWGIEFMPNLLLNPLEL